MRGAARYIVEEYRESGFRALHSDTTGEYR